MSDFAKGMMVILLSVAVFFLAFGAGVVADKSATSADCENYGAVKLNGKLYECKLK
ncbi:hypothetical protein [Nitrosovibrio sp. Nv4]|uniref:hypothetical protein n=1 Tax=Nitrosovibrio sp. Nv4 TaxID=1945880 RepID=UPI000BCD9AA3|nr:hypothetical protein [Nitrosovibrio sp. Nv4]SOD42396.1 hypothetical protein SAMN06298226_2735 [Nitrosovibrio sp. Nv4]